MPAHCGFMVIVLSGRVLKKGGSLACSNYGWSLLTTGGNPETGPRDRLYVPTLSGEGGELGARPEDMPGVGEPKEKELCAGPPAPLGHDDGPCRCGMVLPGGLRLGSPTTAAPLTTTT
jgi:hypothetical protein